MKSFSDKLANEIVLFDGGTGTLLYDKGIYINRCFDELNITNPELVIEVHKEYVSAGADVIETNTYGANIFKLTPHGLENKIFEINKRGAELARSIAKDSVYVAGSVGPLGTQIEPLGKLAFSEAKDAFKEQMKGLIAGGVDLMVLESFSSVPELEQAIIGLRELAPDMPVIAQIMIGDDLNLVNGTPLLLFVEKIARYNVSALGFNCSVGPKLMLDALEIIKPLSSIPISIQPNAGIPQNVGGRNMYMASPEYLAEYAKRFIQSGASIVGGCCGTNGSHIRAMRRAVQALQPTKRMDISTRELKIDSTPDVKIYEKEEKSRFSTKLARKEFVKLVELTSPKGVNPTREIDKARKLHYFGIDGINIPDGPRASARMSALSMALMIQRDVGIETVLHYACRDRNVIGMQSDLLGAWAMGIRNVLSITGDPPKLGNYPDATAVFDIDAIGLTNLIMRLNHGLDLTGNPIGEPTGYCVGVGVNPGAINLDEEIRRLDYKIEAGAEYMITQPVFDIKIFERFLKRIECVKIPLLCGIWPLVSYRNAQFMNNEVPGASVPDDIMERMRKTETKEAAFEEGIGIARETLQKVRGEVAGVQLSAPLGRIDAVMKILG